MSQLPGWSMVRKTTRTEKSPPRGGVVPTGHNPFDNNDGRTFGNQAEARW